MKAIKPTSAADFKLSSSFEEVRQKLLEDRFADRLSKPLAYWALPNDRRLPLAFLGRTLGDLLKTPFDQLSGTPGIGQKKISSLVKLLHRATKDDPPSVPFGLPDLANENGAKQNGVKQNGVTNGQAIEKSNSKFDPSVVSEALWAKWRDAVKRHDLGHERLGHLAPSLQHLPTVIWYAPLSQYLDVSIADMRKMRTHGEKRVRCVLEVFHTIYQQICNAPLDSNFVLRLMPKFAVPIEKWIYEFESSELPPSEESIRRSLTDPLLHQLEVDAAPNVCELVRERLGIDNPPVAVRNLASAINVTRARIYQLLEECKRILNVRWPEGQTQLEMLAMRFKSEGWADLPSMRLFFSTCDLFVFDRHYSQHEEENELLSTETRESTYEPISA